jgi:hypothetical protein
MGLKTTNYEVKKLGIALPIAYAKIENLVIRGKYARADFVIQIDRKATESKAPIERVSVEFALNRNESPFVTAYNTAKMSYKGNAINEETGEIERVTKYNPFYGWEDDIV